MDKNLIEILPVCRNKMKPQAPQAKNRFFCLFVFNLLSFLFQVRHTHLLYAELQMHQQHVIVYYFSLIYPLLIFYLTVFKISSNYTKIYFFPSPNNHFTQKGVITPGLRIPAKVGPCSCLDQNTKKDFFEPKSSFILSISCPDSSTKSAAEM